MDEIDRIRAFNRFYTREIGLLGRGVMGSGLNLSEARVLYEVDAEPGRSARDLAGVLGLDEGYLSRMIKKFTARGWIRRRRSEGDARRSELTLSAGGAAVLEPLKREARARVGAQIAQLSPDGRAELVAAMERIRALLGGDEPEIGFRDLEIGDAGWLIQRHGELYAAEEGFDAGLEAVVAEILAAFIRDRDPGRERAWIAHRGARRLGSIFCVKGDAPGVAKLRLFLLEPEVRGQGLGHRMMEMCLGFARQAGYEKMVLWTHESHHAACALYAAHGFRLTEAKPVVSFGQELVEQSWEIVFRA